VSHSKNTLITGANGFLGQRLSMMYLESGFSLILMARKFDDDFTKSLQNKCNKSQTIDFICCDLLNSNELNEVIMMIKKKYQSLNVLVNNAAIQNPISDIENLDIDDWKMNIELNLNVPVLMCNTMTPLLKKNSFSSIINISGGGATGPRPDFCAYAASKTALVRFTEIIALELEKYNIHVNAIAPGVMPSQMMKDIITDEKVNDKEKKTANNSITEPFEINGILDLFEFLSSEMSAGITGRLISAKWDNWKQWPSNLMELIDKDLYTLRRITARDKGLDWGDK